MTEQIHQAKKDFSRFGFALLAIAVITTLLQVLVVALFQYSPILENELMRWILTMAPMYLVGVPVGYLLIRRIPAETAEQQKLSFGRFWVLFLICLPIMYGGNLIGTCLSSLLSGGNAENVLLDYIMGNPLYSFLFTVLLAPFLEELIFRKLLIDRLGKYGEKTVLLFSAAAFGLFHMNLFQFFYAFGLGLIFAYVYIRTRRLRYPVIMHMIINFLGSVVAPLLLSLVDLDALTSLETGALAAEEMLAMLPGMLAYLGYLLVYLGCVIAGLVLLILRWKKRSFQASTQELPAGAAFRGVYVNAGVISFAAFCLLMIVLALF